MCMPMPYVRGVAGTNWDGGIIVNEAIVRSTRPVVGRRVRYDVDPREFLLHEKNAVLRRALAVEIPRFVACRHGVETLDRFRGRGPGSFDLRADLVAEFVADTVRYDEDVDDDAWQYPDETLAAKVGDCEDRALLLAALLRASGISPFNVKVALGALSIERKGRAPEPRDHAWVVYRGESGRWMVLDPHAFTPLPAAPVRAVRTEPAAPVRYVPRFLFNDAHVWAMRREDAGPRAELRQGWAAVQPAFVGLVHKTILNEAIGDLADAALLRRLNRRFTAILGKDAWTIDAADAPGSYHPADHFDNAFIARGWARVEQRLAAFKASGRQDADAFALAAHGIGDFYAHTNYVHACVAAKRTPIPPYAGPGSLAGLPLNYTKAPFDIAGGEPSFNPRLIAKSKLAMAAQRFAGKLISGRYAQDGDSRSLAEAATGLPDSVANDPEFTWRGALPHHDDIAVDEEDGSNEIDSSSGYDLQFRARKKVAVKHIRAAFEASAP